ncbi:MAG: Gmad2 immunoglobulin-like domain-containing protein [Acidimicrobiia bacterium]
MRHLIACVLILAAACGGQTDVTTIAPDLSSTTTTLPSSSTTTASPLIGCPSEADFVGSGQIERITQPSSDSRTLGLVSRQVVDGCERFGFDFDTAENAPATTPPSVTASFLEGERVIRIALGIDRTVITDQLIETRLVDRLFVVRSLDGSIFIDLHLNEKANVRVSLSNTPARLTIELHPASGEIGTAASVSSRTVLLTPVDGATVGENVEVTGYARTAEANVVVVAARGNEVLLEESTTAADWVETWGEFRTTVTLPAGQIDLFVGEESPADGSLQGVTLRLTVR